MYGSWLRTREEALGFDLDRFDDNNINNIIKFLDDALRSNRVNICIFQGPIKHWEESIKYSFEGERGYVLWGDSGEGKGIDEVTGFRFGSLVKRYREGHLQGERLKQRGEIAPLIAVFYATKGTSGERAGVLGFGLITDIDFDVYRNFRGWSEGERLWLYRFRIKVLYLDRTIRENPDPNEWRGEELKELNVPPGNNCYDKPEIKSRIMRYVQEKLASGEVRATLEFYGAPPKLSIGGGTIDEIVGKISRELFIDEELIRRVVNEVRFGNVLLAGPPGVGKTSLAVEVGKALGSRVIVKVANALWFRRDVIGGETMEGGSVKWKAGFIIHAYNEAAKRPGLVVLVIDELNRADADKAFGDFFAIFRSPNPEDWEIPDELADEVRGYGNNVDKEAEEFLRYYEKYGDEPLRRIRIIGTMNVVDVRNLFLVGEALLRRFVITEIKCPGPDAGDVEKLLDKYGGRIDDEHKKAIIDLVRNMREELKGRPCISPGALKISIALLNEDFEQGRVGDVLSRFYEYLKSSMGVLIGNDAKKLEKAYNNARRRE